MAVTPNRAARNPGLRPDRAIHRGEPRMLPQMVTGEGYAHSNQTLLKALNRYVDEVARSAPRRTAAGWVFASVMAVWAEDHGLIPQNLRVPASGLRPDHACPSDDAAARIRRGYSALAVHPSTRCLLDPRYSPLTDPEPDQRALAALLEWWAEEAPDLAYPDPPTGPVSITGWIVADLLQGLSGDRIDGNAFTQTPWFVADLLCGQTLVPAAAAFPNRTLRVIDPAAGGGHLLVWATQGMHALYTAGAPGWPPVSAQQSVRRIIDGVHGVELDPLTAAVARLRMTVLAAALLGGTKPLRLHEIPAWVRPRIAVGNALLAGLGDPHPPGTVLDDTADYPGILTRGTYHAVIANPPYKAIADPVVRDAVRSAYRQVCHGKYPASVPFAKLLFDLAISGDDPASGAQPDVSAGSARRRGCR